MENKINEVLQHVEFDATSYVPVSSTLEKSSTLEETRRVEEDVVSVDVPHDEETTEDVEDKIESIVTRRPKRVIKKPR